MSLVKQEVILLHLVNRILLKPCENYPDIKNRKNVNSRFKQIIQYYKYMKYIEKSRLEKFLNLKGYQLEFAESTETKQDFVEWAKSTTENFTYQKSNTFRAQNCLKYSIAKNC